MQCRMCGVVCEDCVSLVGRLLWEEGRLKNTAVVLPENIVDCPSRKDILNAIEKRNEEVHKAQQEYAKNRMRQGRLL